MGSNKHKILNLLLRLPLRKSSRRAVGEQSTEGFSNTDTALVLSWIEAKWKLNIIRLFFPVLLRHN